MGADTKQALREAIPNLFASTEGPICSAESDSRGFADAAFIVVYITLFQ